MRKDYRECGGGNGFNTGQNFCPLQPGKVKGIILVYHGKKLPSEITAESLEEACHADGMDRIFPVLNISEYAQSGGEATTSENGYGGSEITGYSSRTDTFTLSKFNLALQANMVANKSTLFDMYSFDEDNVIYGLDDGTENLAGIPLSGIYPTGQMYTSSGQKAYLAFNAIYADTEEYLAHASVKGTDLNLANVLTGLVYTEFVPVEGGFKLVDHYDRTDLTSYYGATLATKAESVLNGVSSMTYEAGILKGTGTPTLKEPSVLQSNGITGIEQW